MHNGENAPQRGDPFCMTVYLGACSAKLGLSKRDHVIAPMQFSSEHSLHFVVFFYYEMI